MTEQRKACGSCIFWARGRDGIEGCGGVNCDGGVSECRAHAPIGLQADIRLHGDRMFPTTKVDDWCGDWRLGPISSRLK